MFSVISALYVVEVGEPGCFDHFNGLILIVLPTLTLCHGKFEIACGSCAQSMNLLNTGEAFGVSIRLVIRAIQHLNQCQKGLAGIHNVSGEIIDVGKL